MKTISASEELKADQGGLWCGRPAAEKHEIALTTYGLQQWLHIRRLNMACVESSERKMVHACVSFGDVRIHVYFIF